jgi:colanic acid biosynthesis glycosyl transferase WcaI
VAASQSYRKVQAICVRILIQSINFSPEMTGIGKYSGEMAEWLASRGHEVRVVSAPPHYPQ